jgi:hypothetical protein
MMRAGFGKSCFQIQTNMAIKNRICLHMLAFAFEMKVKHIPIWTSEHYNFERDLELILGCFRCTMHASAKVFAQ